MTFNSRVNTNINRTFTYINYHAFDRYFWKDFFTDVLLRVWTYKKARYKLILLFISNRKIGFLNLARRKSNFFKYRKKKILKHRYERDTGLKIF